jgi:hypothetical protein
LFLSWVMIKIPVSGTGNSTILFCYVWIYTKFVLFFVCLMVFNASFNNISADGNWQIKMCFIKMKI